MIAPAEASGQHSLPLWAQVVSLVTSLILAAIQVFQFSRQPKLEVHLTRDLFFRLINQGEALFCKAVLLARNGPVLVRDVQPTLRRFDPTESRSQAEKRFPLEVWRHGESVRGSNALAEHHFFGSSPLAYIEPDKPQRAVYWCLQREYWKQQKAIADRFVQAVEALRQRYQSAASDILNAPDQAQNAQAELLSILDRYHQSMVNLIQLESGTYELTVSITYEVAGRRLWKRKKFAGSRLRFTVEDALLDNWRNSFRSTLDAWARQILTNSNETIIFPELEPNNCVESLP